VSSTIYMMILYLMISLIFNYDNYYYH
jgi:hypothetical protein